MDGKHSRLRIVDGILFGIVSGFCVGIILGAFADAGREWLWGIGTVGAAAFLCAAFRPFRRSIFIGVFLLASILGIMRMNDAKPDLSVLADKVDQKVTVRGIIDGPEFRSSGIQFTLDTGTTNIIVSTKDYQTLAYGDEVEVTGKLRKPDNFTTDQGTEFDYVSYLYKDDILYRMSYAKVTVLSHGHGNWLVAHLAPVEDWFLDSFARVLPVKDADLEGGLVLGSKENISPEFRDDLVATGTIHIIALSGYNVTIVANALRDLFVDILGLSAGIASGAGAICIVIFVIMTGLQSSAIRAGIMALIGLFARNRGRTYSAFRALVLAGFLMILYDPKYLVYDVSFQLSYLATLGIIFITPVLERAFARVPKKILWVVPVQELMSVTLGAQLGVLPFILYKMGTLSLIALPANILVLPAVPYAMAFGTLAGLVGKVSIMLATPVAMFTSLLLKYITGMVTFFAKVPYASVVVHQFPLWLCVILYCVLIAWLYRSWGLIKKQ